MSFLKAFTRFFSTPSKQAYTDAFEQTHAQFLSAFAHVDIHAPVSEDFYVALERSLLSSDVGLESTKTILQDIKKAQRQGQLTTIGEAFKHASRAISQRFKPYEVKSDSALMVIMMVGVNGSGKTTSAAKLGHMFKKQGQRVGLIAADTFRAAAVLQLKTWAERCALDFYEGQANQDPASVIVDGLRAAQNAALDVVIIDTAGRLESKHQLMQELAKMHRVIEKVLGHPADHVFLVLDGSTGQNALIQAEAFRESAQVSGIICTKMEASAKGGVLIALADRYRLPVVMLGVGERIEDLIPFDAQRYSQALLGEVYAAE